MPFTTGEDMLLQLDSKEFDFSLQFEQLFFSIVPSALFIVASSWRTLSQARKPKMVHAPTFQYIKLGAITAYVCLALALVVLAAVSHVHVSSMFMAAVVLRVVAVLLMMALSAVEHSRNPRPSTLLTTYLCLTLLLDAAQARTLFLSSTSHSERVYSGIFCAAVALKAGILVLEARQKASWVRWNNDEKEHSPEETSGIFSLGVFFWLNKLFLAGYRTILTLETLLPLDSSLDAEALHAKFSRNMDYAKLKGDKFSLAKVLARTLKVPLLLPIAPRLALLGFTFCQPFFIETLLGYLAEPKLNPNIGYGLIGASFFIYSGIATSMAFTWYFHHRLRIMMRSILVPEIFIKATKARVGAADDSAALTLMSTDLERIRMGFRTLHELWACLVQVALAAWMLYRRLGVVFVAAIGIVIVCFACLGVLINFTGDAQRAWMARVQTRVGLTATVIASMKNLKISGLSAAVGDFVQRLRIEELAAGARFRRIFIAAALFGFIPLLFGPPLVFAFTQRALDNSRVFTSLSFLTLMTIPLSQVFQAVPEIVSGFACLGRIQAFLECETREDVRQLLVDAEALPEVELAVKDAKFGWEADKFVLQNVNFSLARSSLTMVVGPVGSGKSTLCRALLGEMPFSEGQVKLRMHHSHVGYCDQTAFLSNGSVRDNIVAFSAFNPVRYAEVINATNLSYDFATLPQGDGTNVGSDGITLSGGQKQRVSLARALYIQADLLVLDDVFSGLDAETEEHVFDQVFGPHGLLRRRRATVVLCTHSVRHLPAADHIIELEDGTIVAQGSFDQLRVGQGFYQHTLSQKSTSTTSREPQPQPQPQPSAARTISKALPAPATDSARQVGDRVVYKHYIKSMGMFLALCSGFFAALWGFFTNFPTVWLTFWTDAIKSAHRAHSDAYYVGIYALLQACASIALLLLGVAIFIISVKRAGANIHRKALNTLIRAPLAFFTKTDTGVVTNLFSQDLNLIDTELPEATINTLVTLAQAAGQIAVMLTSSAYLAISYPFLGALLYVVQRFYLRTSRQIRLLDLEAKSPLYTHFLDTVKGITTLRAFGFMPDDVQRNARLIGCSQRPAYLLLMIQEWLNLVLNVVVMIMAVLLTTFAVRLHSKSGFAGASLYSLLTLGENLSGIVIYWTKLETSLGAIARLKSFGETVTPEDMDEEDIVPSERWPRHGVVALQGISASYEEQVEGEGTPKLALRDIHLTVASGERVAICGRTGSGKSSLIALLLKLVNPLPETAGNATIDGTPLRRLNRLALRQRIIAMPQEAVFLPDGCTFRTNVDPLGVSTAAECEEVLTAVGLWSFVVARGGLDAGMSAGTLSAGQRQLMSVGRALLRQRIRARQQAHGGILLLDEVSSSVDVETERIMQEIIRNEFNGYTVIAVSHRLDMIMDFDRVIVMDTGEIVEIGNPVELAGAAGTRFGDLVRAARAE
ncbi:putative ABC multidrug transporter [Trematosphaeria pertusa]|uniref:Putative ABC multidrug transporter n=1 Tax=Trematosphaeria pertusa TaxID=390896 RepID=A0A6A6HUF2_9PLEO|nr:putative ABC multidrug transporter [Trematosphaeria pertusa]KAF2241163.1 putative ABC multidrug transporter [Trematosphaeria pertusa]